MGAVDLAVSAADLARIRFVVSPVAELVWSTVALRKPHRRWMHGSWRDRVAPRVPACDLLRAMTSGRRYLPDFLLPVTPEARPSLASELAVVAGTDPDRALAEVRRIDVRSAPLDAFLRDPVGGLRRLVEQMHEYFERALADDWARLRALAEADVTYRAARIADHGAIGLFADLHSEVRWYGGRVSTRVGTGNLGALGERPAVLIPTAFAWPNASSSSEVTDGWRLCYPPRGVGTLWAAATKPAPALTALLGATRAGVLRALGVPRSTGEVAVLLRITAPTASHHLSVLRAAGLATSRRQGRHTTYVRTVLGDHLVESCG